MWLKIWHSKYLLWLIFFLAVASRVFAISLPAHPYDMATFQAWGSRLLQVGPLHFYENTWSDYLPLPLYFTALISTLSTWLHLSFGLVFKSVVSLLELSLIIAITRSFRPPSRLLLFSLLALSPALLLDSAFWGQLDTIPALLALLSLTHLITPGVKGAHTPGVLVTSVLFGLAVAIKPIMILVTPILWILAFKKGKGWQFPLFSALTFFATALPMAGLASPRLLWERTLEQAGTYPFTTINAWNIWSLVPLATWPPDNQIILALSAHTAGLLMFGLLSFLILRNWYRTGWSPKFVFRVVGTILVTFFVFTTRMHERHLLFGLPFLALATIYESWLFIPLVLFTLTFCLNLYAAYYWVNHAQTWLFSPEFTSHISWINTLIGLGLACVWHWPTFLKSLILNLKSHKFLVGILLLASLLRFINLGHPPVYIFDEVYHAFTAREYIAGHIEAWEWWTTPPEGVAYEWTHPGVAKYGMVLGMLLFGENSFGWRFGSAALGVISILGLYLLVFSLTKNKSTALLSAFLVSIEGTHIAQSRIAMNDIYMLTFYIWALYAAVTSRWKSAAILYGLALGSKWSALYGVIPLAYIYLRAILPLHFNLKSFIIISILNPIRLLAVVVLVYTLTFTPFILAGHTWEQFIELHRQMWYYHTHLVATHAYQSTPWEWIFAARPVWYWVDYAGDYISHIFVQGNPLILWLGLAALVLQFRAIRYFRYSLFLVLYFVFTLPWISSPRIMFYYHYLPSATFLCIILATWLSQLSPRTRNGLMVVCCTGLILVSPMLYGFPIPTAFWDHFFHLFSSWK